MKIISYGITDQGQKRLINEDAFLLDPALGLAIVADGMGGHSRGDVAAQLACSVIKEGINTHRHVLELLRRSPSEAAKDAVNAMLSSVVQRACKEVHDANKSVTHKTGQDPDQPPSSIMGTTIDVLLVVGRSAFIAHVGDGRILLMRDEKVHQLTADHTLDGPDGAGDQNSRTSSNIGSSNVITRALGAFASVTVDTLCFDIDLNDKLLICTDGLHRYLSAQEMALMVRGGIDTDTVHKMVDLANERGGSDNITAVICCTDTEWTGEIVAPSTERIAVLRRSALFQYCTYRELIEVCQAATRREYPPNTVLFEEGDAGHECFIVVRGVVSIQKNGQQLAMLQSADHFGEMSFIDEPSRSAKAVTMTNTECITIRRDRFLQLMKQDGDLASKLMWQLLKILSQRVRVTSAQLAQAQAAADSKASPTS